MFHKKNTTSKEEKLTSDEWKIVRYGLTLLNKEQNDLFEEQEKVQENISQTAQDFRKSVDISEQKVKQSDTKIKELQNIIREKTHKINNFGISDTAKILINHKLKENLPEKKIQMILKDIIERAYEEKAKKLFNLELQQKSKFLAQEVNRVVNKLHENVANLWKEVEEQLNKIVEDKNSENSDVNSENQSGDTTSDESDEIEPDEI